MICLPNPGTDKDALARQVAQGKKITSRLVCAISAMEPSPTFEHRGVRIRRVRPCHPVLYQYQIHPVVAWMYARISDMVSLQHSSDLNGREWLAGK